MRRRALILAFRAVAFSAVLRAQQPGNVLVVVNQNSDVSQSIGEYYVLKRRIPLANVCRIRASTDEIISRTAYAQSIAAPVAAYLKEHHFEENILYIVTTLGVPLRVAGAGASPSSDAASVDSELTLLYGQMKGRQYPLPGIVENPFFAQTGARFAHPNFPIYLVTRLAGYNFPDVKALIDRSLNAANRGKFVIDLKEHESEHGNEWLHQAAQALPRERVILDDSSKVLLNQTDVIAYASWGSNDSNRKQRTPGFKWLPGAIMTEYVSTNARTFKQPPEHWTLGNWIDQHTWFAGSPQTLTADYIHEGVTGASGHVDEPYLYLTPRPQLLLPAYYHGRNLAESYYLAIPGLSWMNVVIGDPLCTLGAPVPAPVK